MNHVTEGIEIAKKNNLPDRVVDFIRTHHGTSPTRYFYHKAKKEDENIDKALFCYPGPKPYSKETANKANKKSKTPVLDNFGRDLTAMAEEGKLDPVVGREKEIQRVSQILSRRKKNNPLLIGEPGVGKSAIAEGLANRIIQRKVSRILCTF